MHQCIAPIWFILLCENINNINLNKLLEGAPHQNQTGVVKYAAVIQSRRLANELANDAHLVDSLFYSCQIINMLPNSPFSICAYFCGAFEMSKCDVIVVNSNKTHTLKRSMYSEHVFMIGCMDETSIRMSSFPILRCTTNISHHRRTSGYLTVPHESNFA